MYDSTILQTRTVTHIMNLIVLAKEHVKDKDLKKEITQLEREWEKAAKFISTTDRFKRLFL